MGIFGDTRKPLTEFQKEFLDLSTEEKVKLIVEARSEYGDGSGFLNPEDACNAYIVSHSSNPEAVEDAKEKIIKKAQDDVEEGRFW